MKFLIPVTFVAANAEQAKDFRDYLAQLVASQMTPDVQVGHAVPAPAAEATIVYTDGGCSKNRDPKAPRIGAWAFVATIPGRDSVEMYGAELDTTNNRMELTAVIKALETLEIGPSITVYSDSEYVVRGIIEWCRRWVKNGWKTYDGKPVINRDLWEALLPLYQLHTVRFHHVKGHSGVPGNERCDELCTQAMTDLHKQILAEAS